MTLTEVTDEAIAVIRKAANPLRIVLFGSAARNEMGPNSDLDILVVVPRGAHRRQTAQKIYRHAVDLGFAMDVVVVTEEDVERYRDNPGMVIKAALAEGRDLYVA